MSNKEFKPAFDGFMKMFLHDDIPERLVSRAVFTGKWVQSKRRRIMKKDRKFQVTPHIMDTDGHKRGLQSMVFKDRGGKGDLSKVIFGFGNEFVDELRAGDKDLQVDLVNSYAVIRA